MSRGIRGGVRGGVRGSFCDGSGGVGGRGGDKAIGLIPFGRTGIMWYNRWYTPEPSIFYIKVKIEV